MRTRVLTAAIISAIAFTLIALTSMAGVRGSSDHAYTYDNLIRLHVIANSNSEHDQETKLRVRDAVLKKASELFAEVRDKKGAQAVLEDHLEEVVECGAAAVKECGDTYAVRAYIGRSWFPAKTYGDIYLPEGEYDALRIVLGKGEGANWWCILFPPLCFINKRQASADKPGDYAGQIRVGETGMSPEFSLESLKSRFEAEARLAAKARILATPAASGLLRWSRIDLSRMISPLTLLYYSALRRD